MFKYKIKTQYKRTLIFVDITAASLHKYTNDISYRF